MVWNGKLEKVDDNRWLISRDQFPGMRTDGVIYSKDRLVGIVLEDISARQGANVACLPGI